MDTPVVVLMGMSVDVPVDVQGWLQLGFVVSIKFILRFAIFVRWYGCDGWRAEGTGILSAAPSRLKWILRLRQAPRRMTRWVRMGSKRDARGWHRHPVLDVADEKDSPVPPEVDSATPPGSAQNDEVVTDGNDVRGGLSGYVNVTSGLRLVRARW